MGPPAWFLSINYERSIACAAAALNRLLHRKFEALRAEATSTASCQPKPRTEVQVRDKRQGRIADIVKSVLSNAGEAGLSRVRSVGRLPNDDAAIGS